MPRQASSTAIKSHTKYRGDLRRSPEGNRSKTDVDVEAIAHGYRQAVVARIRGLVRPVGGVPGRLTRNWHEHPGRRRIAEAARHDRNAWVGRERVDRRLKHQPAVSQRRRFHRAWREHGKVVWPRVRWRSWARRRRRQGIRPLAAERARQPGLPGRALTEPALQHRPRGLRVPDLRYPPPPTKKKKKKKRGGKRGKPRGKKTHTPAHVRARRAPDGRGRDRAHTHRVE